MSKENAERLFRKECDWATFTCKTGDIAGSPANKVWSAFVYPRKGVTPRSNYRFIWIVWHGKDIIDGGIVRTKRTENACNFAVMKLFEIKGHKA